jgi:hypothetical protein
MLVVLHTNLSEQPASEYPKMATIPREKEDIVAKEGKTLNGKYVDGPLSSASSGGVTPDKGAVNLLLLVACMAFGSASFLFGYDDKVISPIAALDAFVSL